MASVVLSLVNKGDIESQERIDVVVGGGGGHQSSELCAEGSEDD